MWQDLGEVYDDLFRCLKNNKYLVVNIQGNPHMLRHYFAQSGLDAGWKLPMIANALGNMSVNNRITLI